MQHGCNIELNEILVDNLPGKGGKIDLWIYAWVRSRPNDVDAVKRTRVGGIVDNSWALRAAHEIYDLGGETAGSYVD